MSCFFVLFKFQYKRHIDLREEKTLSIHSKQANGYEVASLILTLQHAMLTNKSRF